MPHNGTSVTNRFVVAALSILFLPASGCNDSSSTGAQRAAPARGIAFTRVSDEAGLGAFRHVTGAVGDKWMPETYGSGAAFLDYDQDAWPDILLVGGGNWSGQDERVRALRLFRNSGNGNFAEVTEEAGLSQIDDYGFAVISSDYDRDGDPDVFFTTLGTDRLLRNDNGRFRDVTAQAGVGGPDAWSSAAVFFDANRDGLTDLFVGGYVIWSPGGDLPCMSSTGEKVYCTPQLYHGAPGHFYLNRGDGSFEDATSAFGLDATGGKTLGALATDFDFDGWPDLYVTNDTDPDQLFRNEGGTRFAEVGVIGGVSYDERGRPRAGMGVTAGIVDDSGLPTLFVGNFASEMIGAYRYLGDGLFEDVASQAGIGRPTLPTLTFGLALSDVDLDGDQDLIAANGHVVERVEESRDNTSYRQIPHLFVNDGTGLFTDYGHDVLGQPIVARGLAIADYDRDGDPDLLFTESGGPVHLWRNDVTGSGYARVTLQGSKSPVDAIGARVRLVAGNMHQFREVRAGTSYLSQDELALTFGLGDAAKIDTMVIAWPSGNSTTLVDLSVPADILVEEGAGVARSVQ
jgi:hypothetical protein